MNLGQTLSLIAALAVHAFVLWGWKPEPPGLIDAAGEPAGVEVELLEPAPLAEEAAPPEPPAEPQLPEPPPVEETPPPPEPPPVEEVMEEPVPQEEPPPEPKPKPKPAPKPVPKPAPPRPAQPSAKPASTQPAAGSPTGAATGPSGGKSDGSARARWKHRVVPEYPSAAKSAGLRGSAMVSVSVNALGQPTGARLVKSSGFPMLDEAALRAARSSTFHPKKTLGLPVPDTIMVPYQFRLER